MSASEQTSAGKRDERYITAPSGKRITESEWMNGGDPECTDEFKQKTFDNFHIQEFASPQQQPDTKTFEQSLMIEVIARFAGRNSRGTSIAKEGFIDGAKWANERVGQPDSLEKWMEHYKDRVNVLAKACDDKDKRIAELEAALDAIIQSDLCGEIYDGGSVVGTKELNQAKIALNGKA